MQTALKASDGQFTVASASATPTRVAHTLPEFIRLPRGGGLCPWTGLSRSKLNELILPTEANGHHPPVRSSVLRKKGALKGVRLVSLRALLAFIEANTERGGR